MTQAAGRILSAALVLLSGGAAAQAPAAGLSLEAALGEALRRNPNTLLQRQQVEASRGFVLQARGLFDAVTSLSATQAREVRPLRLDESRALVAAGIAGIQEQVIELTSYRAGVDHTMMNGISVGSAFIVNSFTDTALSVQNVPRQTEGRVAFTLRVPLLRNAGRDAVGATLDAAQTELAAAEAGLLHTNAQTVLATALAYWDLAARERRLGIARAGEARIGALVDEMRKLIAEDQVPAAELNLALANLSEKRIARVSAEQALREARLVLARQIGLAPEEAASLAPPAQALPATDAAAAVAMRDVDGLARFALAERADIRAARLAEQAARYGVAAARQNLKPQLDLNFGVAYAGLSQGPGPGSPVAALNTATAGPSATATVVLALPWDNAGARGVFTTRSAFLDSASIRLRDLLAAVSSNVPVLAEALRRAAEQLAEGAESVRRYATTLENEQTKRRLGSATLIDVINVEDRLSNALAAEVSLRQGYANAIVRLRFEIGALVRREGDTFVVRVGDLERASFDEALR
ncbi:MAG: TolC family protein [Betaproteobacteria bacterium]